ncbi:DUF6600 domain-containing protein [Massilia niastensis]|uniref:DUF6600 domain-containing protein n=1 Tax=Massilia niastensis TaxID=544911 RepID=UPI00035C79A7|nr:DUF6600 domain-containing protein [Massilia niastensis]
MINRFAKTASLLALAAFATLAPAQEDIADGDEPPGRVGRVSLIQGKVSIGGDVGDAVQDALVNWPVTSRNLITTAMGARTEVRIGSTSIRLDGDSSLEVTELDDDSLRLRLHYGSASVRIVSADVAPEFELATVHARVRMQQPGRLRVDAERRPDTSLVSVFGGEAVVEGAGASLLLRAGRSAEVRDDDVRTLQASRDGFDDWSLTRDSHEDSARSSRYVTTDMTGYEDLDRHGSWSTDVEYGALWMPAVAAGWAPYRDGRWTWIAPWGWTWVDNAPWGYAPFHYGRWVYHNRRWAWAPGHRERRPVWSPALVGWVGGNDWNVHFNSRQTGRPLPAQGWYPLGPRDRFVPGYRLSDDRLRRLNTHDWRDGDRKGDRDGRRDDRRDDRRHDRREGLTVVPNAHFGQRGPVVVPNLPKANTAPLVVPGTVASAPPPPQGWRNRIEQRERDRERDRDAQRIDRSERFDHERAIRDRAALEAATRDRTERMQAIQDQAARDRAARDRAVWERAAQDRIDRDRIERQRAPLMATDPAPMLAQPPRQQSWQRPDRDRGFDEGRRQRPPQAAMPAPVPQAAPAPQSQPQPQPRPMPPPQAIAPPPPRAMPAPSAPPRMRGEERAHTDERGVRHQER